MFKRRFKRHFKRLSKRQPKHAAGVLSGGATQKALRTAELLENILLFVPMRHLLTTVPLVCKHWKSILDTSPSLHKALFLRPADTANEAADSAPRIPNRHLKTWPDLHSQQSAPSSTGERGTVVAMNPLLLSPVQKPLNASSAWGCAHARFCRCRHQDSSQSACFGFDSSLFDKPQPFNNLPLAMLSMLLTQPPTDICIMAVIEITTNTPPYAGEVDWYNRPIRLRKENATFGDLIRELEKECLHLQTCETDPADVNSLCIGYDSSRGWPPIADHEC